MSEQKNERTYQDSGTRAGGDVVTKGASQRPAGDENSGQRAGGDVVTKGASHGIPDEADQKSSGTADKD